MLGFLVSVKEVKELEYLIKREMEEILFDMEDERIDQIVKHAMIERYTVLFSLFKRVAPPSECINYIFTNKSMASHFKNE